jgi:glutamate racemase
VSSADETAFALRARLAELDLARLPVDQPSLPSTGNRRFLSSGDVGWFADLGRRLLGPELAAAEFVRW